MREEWIVLKKRYRRGMKGTSTKYQIIQLWPNKVFCYSLGSWCFGSQRREGPWCNIVGCRIKMSHKFGIARKRQFDGNIKCSLFSRDHECQCWCIKHCWLLICKNMQNMITQTLQRWSQTGTGQKRPLRGLGKRSLFCKRWKHWHRQQMDIHFLWLSLGLKSQCL